MSFYLFPQDENEEELAAIKADLLSMLSEDESVLAVPLGNETEQQPGMLSEEKVGKDMNKLVSYFVVHVLIEVRVSYRKIIPRTKRMNFGCVAKVWSSKFLFNLLIARSGKNRLKVLIKMGGENFV